MLVLEGLIFVATRCNSIGGGVGMFTEFVCLPTAQSRAEDVLKTSVLYSPFLVYSRERFFDHLQERDHL